MPRVSVIIPTYNRGSLLHKAIDSVLSQGYDDFELVIVDDGSTDDTNEIVKQYDSDKLIYVYQQNKGRSAARNHGIKLARGEYIAFLDSDDMFLPSKLELQVEALDNNPLCGLVYSHAKNIDESGNYLNYHFEGDLSGWIYPDLLFIKNNFITTPTVMVRAKVLADLGGFDESMHICEDLDLWRRIAREYQVMQICKPLAMIRMRSEERIDILGFMNARTRYYNKAIEQDPSLNSIKKELFAEMYKVYLDCAINYKDKKIYFALIYKAIINSPVVFLNMVCSRLERINIINYLKWK